MGIKEWYENQEKNTMALAVANPSGYWKYKEKQAQAIWGAWGKMFDFMAIAIFSAALWVAFYYAFK